MGFKKVERFTVGDEIKKKIFPSFFLFFHFLSFFFLFSLSFLFSFFPLMMMRFRRNSNCL